MSPGMTSAVANATSEQPDDVLIRQVLAGNTAVFELLMRRYNEQVYRAARAIVRDEAESEDVMQQAYVNAFTHLRQFNGSARFSTWLTRIAINEALARVRRLGRYAAALAFARDWPSRSITSPQAIIRGFLAAASLKLPMDYRCFSQRLWISSAAFSPRPH